MNKSQHLWSKVAKLLSDLLPKGVLRRRQCTTDCGVSAALNLPKQHPSRRLGFMAGQIKVPDDFDRMGGPEIEKMFEGSAPPS